MDISEKIKRIVHGLKVPKKRNINDIQEIEKEELKYAIESGEKFILVDVRSPQEFEEGAIAFATNIPLYELNAVADFILPNDNQKIILYCKTGIRSKKAYKILEKKGYKNIYSLKGGIEEYNS